MKSSGAAVPHNDTKPEMTKVSRYQFDSIDTFADSIVLIPHHNTFDTFDHENIHFYVPENEKPLTQEVRQKSNTSDRRRKG